jgi:hypothetical protein
VFWTASAPPGTDTSNIRIICSAPNGVDTFNYTVTRPAEGALIPRYLPNGTVDTVTMDPAGIYLNNGQGLFAYYDTVTSSGVLVVANFTNDTTSIANIPNQSSLALICYRQDLIGSQPYSMNVKWLPNSILIPVQRTSTFVQVLYDSQTGRCSWLDNRYLPRIQTLETEVQTIETEITTIENEITTIETELAQKEPMLDRIR